MTMLQHRSATIMNRYNTLHMLLKLLCAMSLRREVRLRVTSATRARFTLHALTEVDDLAEVLLGV